MKHVIKAVFSSLYATWGAWAALNTWAPEALTLNRMLAVAGVALVVFTLREVSGISWAWTYKALKRSNLATRWWSERPGPFRSTERPATPCPKTPPPPLPGQQRATLKERVDALEQRAERVDGELFNYLEIAP